MELVVSFFMAQGLATVVPAPFSPVTAALQPALTSRHRDAGVPVLEWSDRGERHRRYSREVAVSERDARESKLTSGQLNGAIGKSMWMEDRGRRSEVRGRRSEDKGRNGAVQGASARE
jgi:hypothetical protein